jgi:hypothetical protein
MRAVQGELASRRYGDAVRLETLVDCPPHVRDFLLERFELAPEDHYAVDGPVNLNRLMAIHDLVDRRDLKYLPFAPAVPRRLIGRPDLFEAIREKDVLLHHPFQSFTPVIDFLSQAAADPHVLAIKQTLYRTGADSPVVDALVAAARAGKEVTVVIELMARFDEAANIDLATRLQEAGAQVMYGVVGFKTHAKLILVVRREQDRLRRYCHLGTGNYHPRTTRQYTDYGLFSCDEAIGEDLHELFLQLTSPTRVAQMRKVLQSPFTMHEGMLERTRREIDHARAGRPARIVAKMNALIEPQIIQGLYAASMAGVKVDLIVRGVCSLRPGVPGVSDNITVRSIVGRFLEHSRVFYFENDGDPEVYCASADWMERTSSAGSRSPSRYSDAIIVGSCSRTWSSTWRITARLGSCSRTATTCVSSREAASRSPRRPGSCRPSPDERSRRSAPCAPDHRVVTVARRSADVLEAGLGQELRQLRVRKLPALGSQEHEQAEGAGSRRTYAGIVEQRLVNEDAASHRQRGVCLGEQARAGGEIPVMQDVGKERRVVIARPFLPEHVDRARADAFPETGCGDVILRDLAHRRQFHDRAAQLRQALRERDAEASRAAADVQQTADTRKIDVAGHPKRSRDRVAVHECGNHARLLDLDVPRRPRVAWPVSGAAGG